MTLSTATSASTNRTADRSATLSATNCSFLQRFIRNHSGIVIEANQRYLLEARLLPLLRGHNIDSLDGLVLELASRPSSPLASLVVEAMTTNETLFFRDSAMFDALRTHVLPLNFTKTVRGRKLRIWSAAASTGQEAYSIAIMLHEMGKTHRDVEILATDLDTQVLARARAGVYTQFDVNRGLPTPHLMKYFVRRGLEWKIQDHVQAMVHFQQFDLRQGCLSFEASDLILCRNVLIYFDAATKRQIVDQLRSALAPGAMLVLGCAETILNIHPGFQRIIHGGSSFYLPS